MNDNTWRITDGEHRQRPPPPGEKPAWQQPLCVPTAAGGRSLACLLQESGIPEASIAGLPGRRVFPVIPPTLKWSRAIPPRFTAWPPKVRHHGPFRTLTCVTLDGNPPCFFGPFARPSLQFSERRLLEERSVQLHDLQQRLADAAVAVGNLGLVN